MQILNDYSIILLSLNFLRGVFFFFWEEKPGGPSQ